MAALAHRAAVALLVAGLLAAGTLTADAFTLIYPKPEVSVSPTSGLPTATFRVRGKEALPGGSCPVGAPAPSINFKFYWYKVTTNKVLLWNTTTNNCSSGKVDTGGSPFFKPPSGLNYPGTFVIQVAVFNPSTGAALGPYYTNTTLYRVLAPPPSPSPSRSAAPACGQVGAAPCASPSPSACTVGAAAMVPSAPSGRDAAVMFALLLAGTIPIGGIAMVASPGLLRRRGTLGRLAALFGLSLILLTASGCTMFSPPPTSQATPSQAAEVSPSASPTTTC